MNDNKSNYNMTQYLEESARTARDLDEVRKDIYEKKAYLIHDLVDLIINGNMADMMKRGLFYKEANEKMAERANKYASEHERLYKEIEKKTVSGEDYEIDAKRMNLIHACLGLMSETAEVLEEVIKSILENRPVDDVNIKEEGGDKLWYLAMLLRAANSTFEEAGEKNIAKLKVRYKEAFSEKEATDGRDLQAERKVLEK